MSIKITSVTTIRIIKYEKKVISYGSKDNLDLRLVRSLFNSNSQFAIST